MPIDYKDANDRLRTAFENAQVALLAGTDIGVPPPHIVNWLDTVFSSNTQAFREVLLGCVLARIQDETINIRKPYVSQGDDAFSGRTLDERVVNPILQEKRIPSSKGPFLSVFRRSVEFNQSTREGVRDKAAYDAFLGVIDFIDDTSEPQTLNQFLNFLAFRFIALREESTIPLARIQRMSLEQIGRLVSNLLQTPSGGRSPVYLIVATFKAIDKSLDLNWEIQWQGINVADSASGVGGDITISSGDMVLLAAEVTERTVDRNRVVATFNTKIGPHGIEDYLFFVTSKSQPPDVADQVKQYFAQGHEINFVVMQEWIFAVLAALGRRGRARFIDQLIELIDSPETPVALKVAWNEAIDLIVTI